MLIDYVASGSLWMFTKLIMVLAAVATLCSMVARLVGMLKLFLDNISTRRP